MLFTSKVKDDTHGLVAFDLIKLPSKQWKHSSWWFIWNKFFVCESNFGSNNGFNKTYVLYSCYKLIQLFRVTCFFAGQYNTGLLWHITDIIFDSGSSYSGSIHQINDSTSPQLRTRPCDIWLDDKSRVGTPLCRYFWKTNFISHYY